MNMKGSSSEIGREDVANHILEMLRTLTEDVNIDPITLQTYLGDTGLDSVCMAYLIGEVQQKYELQDAVYRALVKANSPILTLRVSEIVNCVCECLLRNSTAEQEG
jgi:acyl carrier protein